MWKHFASHGCRRAGAQENGGGWENLGGWVGEMGGGIGEIGGKCGYNGGGGGNGRRWGKDEVCVYYLLPGTHCRRPLRSGTYSNTTTALHPHWESLQCNISK